MNTVSPIRDRSKIEEIKEYLRSTSPRDYALFTIGINSALRISDLLSLKVSDVLSENHTIRKRIMVRQKKTGREARPLINEPMREALEYYFECYGNGDMNQLLFRSRTGKPLDNVRAWQLIQHWVDMVELEGGPYGTHSMRKTWGYHARQSGVPLEIIMEKLGQSSIEVTKRYIGVTEDEINDWEDRICL